MQSTQHPQTMNTKDVSDLCCYCRNWALWSEPTKRQHQASNMDIGGKQKSKDLKNKFTFCLMESSSPHDTKNVAYSGRILRTSRTNQYLQRNLHPESISYILRRIHETVTIQVPKPVTAGVEHSTCYQCFRLESNKMLNTIQLNESRFKSPKHNQTVWNPARASGFNCIRLEK